MMEDTPYKSKFGNEKCVLCNKNYNTSKDFCQISSSRGKTDVQALIKSFLNITLVDGLICRKVCLANLCKIQKWLTDFKAAVISNTKRCAKGNDNEAARIPPSRRNLFDEAVRNYFFVILLFLLFVFRMPPSST